MSRLTEEQKERIIELKSQGMKSRKIALEVLGRESAKSTVNDLWAKHNKLLGGTRTSKQSHTYHTKCEYADDVLYGVVTTSKAKVGGTHLMIPDTQCKPGIDMTYLEVLGEYIARKQPDVIVHIGDHADMESLSSYDKGKKTAEGKRVAKDIAASIEGMNKLLKPVHDLQQSQLKEYGKVLYKPKMCLTLGNHEQRIERHVDANPELHGFLGYDSLRYEDFGWEVYDFLKPVIINGVSYVHYMANPMTGKPYGGTALNILKNVGESFCMGHKQCLDVATRFLPSSGKQQWAIIAGAYYAHNEGYKGHQGNHHFRGIVVQHRVECGTFEPMFVSMEYLLDRFG